MTDLIDYGTETPGLFKTKVIASFPANDSDKEESLVEETSSGHAADGSPKPAAFVRKEDCALNEGQQLAALGLGSEGLTANGKANLRVMASVVQQLGLTSGRKAAILARILQLRSEQWELDDSQAQAEQLRGRLQAQIQVLHQSMDELGKVSKAVTNIQAGKLSELAERDQRRLRSEMKANSYVEELASLQAKLKKVGLTEELRHESLVSRHAALSAKQESIAALKARLEHFKGMPADLEAAHQLYADTYAKLQEATRQFDDSVAQL